MRVGEEARVVRMSGHDAGREETDLSLEGVKTRIRGRHAFVHERVLEIIVQQSKQNGSVRVNKATLAEKLGCCVRSVDRSISRLRRDGLIRSTPVFNENGAQLGNEYCATAKGVARAKAFKPEREPRRR